MKRVILPILAALLLAGCASETGSLTPSGAPAATRATSSPTAAVEMTDDDVRDFTEGYFLSTVKEEIDVSVYADDDLLAAADAVCASQDRGETVQTMLIAVAALLPDLESTDDVASFAGVADGTICTLP